MKYLNVNVLSVAVAAVFGLSGVTLLVHGMVKSHKPILKDVATVTVPQAVSKSIPTLSLSKQILNLQLPKDQVVVLAGEIGENALGISQEITAKANNKKPVFLLISSPGGSVMDGAFIINAIEAAPAPVITVCMDLCASMAAIIHQYGASRLMLDRSIVMFHDAAGGFQGYFPHMKSRFNTIDRYIARFNVFIAARAKISLEELVLAEHTELWVDAEDSLGKFADGLAYIQVMESNNKQADLKALLRPQRTTKVVLPAQEPTFFDLTWISK